jgi:hypothetical protein
MSWDIELTLNTDYKRFESWFDAYCCKTLPRIFNLEDRKTLHVRGGATLEREHQGFRYYQIGALFGNPSPINPEELEMTWSSPVLLIELFEPANSRLSVKIECKHTALGGYYLDLLSAIAKRYPESAPTILSYLSSLYPDPEKQELSAPTDSNTGKAELPPNITSAEIDTLPFDVDRMRKVYRDFSEDKAREILKAIPKESKKLQRNEKLRSGVIAKNLFTTPSPVSNHLRALYTMGLRTVDGIPLPYKPRNPTK